VRDPLITYITSRPGSALGDLAEAALSRDGELEEQCERGTLHPLMHHAEELVKAADTIEHRLEGYDARANARNQVADYIDAVVLPGTYDPRLRRLPDKLRAARKKAWSQVDLSTGETRFIWDEKAGEPLLCPDDAREEGMRLQRRLEGKLEELARAGLRVYYGVLTIDNAPLGHMAARVEKLWRKFKRALKAKASGRPRGVSKKSWPKLFPIAGAIATLECPLSASRTWHPHLNVIFVTRGFFDWSAWWQHWQCVSHFQELKPGNVAAAFRELIKYAVRAVPEKSAAKAGSHSTCNTVSQSSFAPSDSVPPAHFAISSGTVMDFWPDSTKASGRSSRPLSAPPAMIEWTRAEWLEWWASMKGRRRTRTYGELYGLNVEPEEEKREWRTIGTVQWSRERFVSRVVLLECIPGDKSIRNPAERYRRWLEKLEPPREIWDGLATIGEEAWRMIQMEQMQP